MLKNSKRLCVFAHFNPQFRVAEYVFYHYCPVKAGKSVFEIVET